MVGDKWTLLIIRDLAAGPRRFVALQRILPGISTEQLRSRLNRMVADGLLTRERYREVPPRVDYELTERARDLLPVIGALARWGSSWVWSAPQAYEAIDIGAILRSVPGIALPSSMDGTIEIVVVGADDTRQHYGMFITGGQARIEERPVDAADASVAGTQDAWIEAFSPQRSIENLQFDGDRSLALEFLGAVSPAATLDDDPA
jgi:DNA-binding HxlR family transcriptional regulator